MHNQNSHMLFMHIRILFFFFYAMAKITFVGCTYENLLFSMMFNYFIKDIQTIDNDSQIFSFFIHNNVYLEWEILQGNHLANSVSDYKNNYSLVSEIMPCFKYIVSTISGYCSFCICRRIQGKSCKLASY